jgi:hypothetical protein
MKSRQRLHTPAFASRHVPDENHRRERPPARTARAGPREVVP